MTMPAAWSPKLSYVLGAGIKFSHGLNAGRLLSPDSMLLPPGSSVCPQIFCQQQQWQSATIPILFPRTLRKLLPLAFYASAEIRDGRLSTPGRFHHAVHPITLKSLTITSKSLH